MKRIITLAEDVGHAIRHLDPLGLRAPEGHFGPALPI